MKLILFLEQKSILFLPPKNCVGRYWLYGMDANGARYRTLCLEARASKDDPEEMYWELRSNQKYRVIDDQQAEIDTIPIESPRLYYFRKVDTGLVGAIYVEQSDAEYMRFSPYRITRSNARIYVGRKPENDICYPSGYVSGQHACITVDEHGLTLQDCHSTNGTYVNQRYAESYALSIGDAIGIMGLQIIAVGRYLFINNPQGMLQIQSNSLEACHRPPQEQSAGGSLVEAPDPEYYYRAPRFKYDVDKYVLKLDAPPVIQNQDELPMAMMIGPSVTMGMASVATGAYSVTSAIGTGNFAAAIPSLVMCISMLLGTMMWPTITRRYQRKMAAQKEQKRQTRYMEYLAQMEEKVEQEIASQEKILWANDISMNILSPQLLSANPKLWERTQKHTDFLTIRLGSGNLPMIADIQYSERRFSVDVDNLFEAMYEFGEKERWLRNVPVCLPLVQRFISGICASREVLYAYAQNAILQIASLHAYDEIRMVVLYNEWDEDYFGFVRWLPHTRDDEKGIRYIARNSEEAKEISYALDPIIEARSHLDQERMKDEDVYYVIVCLDKGLIEKTECIRRILKHKSNLKFSVMCFCQRLEELPKECSAVVEIDNDKGQMTLIDDISQPPIPFWRDRNTQLNIRSISRLLANTEIDITGFRFELPKSYSLFQMLHIGMIEHLNLTKLWQDSDATTSLAAQIGIDAYGEPLKLDLHERAHGPHGLVAGTTGSGKSEFLIGYILSMSIQFPPNDVAFILIDYKGGGMAKSFEGMPHVAGMITNLDGNGINRSLVSMRSELHRRERIFAQTSRQHGISNIDIYKYQRLYHEGKVPEPLPHLIIISDEFAELKKEQPDFMTELTSTARVGRSLGVHLILATQKPGGIVDEQIRSNSNFKICLKVQDTGDSTEMLGRPEAAALVDPGRFYFQVGSNELFEMGQSVWAGAPYYPSQEVAVEEDDSVTVISTTGRIIAEAKTNRFLLSENPPKQLDVTTQYIRQVCEREGIRAWKMWLDPIPPRITIDDLRKKYLLPGEPAFMLNPLIGEYDDPAHQLQAPLYVPLSSDGNVIVYGSAGSGKSLFIEAMCYSLICQHTPEEVNLYLMDFDAELLVAFSGAPHVGDVILSHEAERVNNLFKLLSARMEDRKKRLSESGMTFAQYNAEMAHPLPSIVVVINNFAAFTELFEDLAPVMNYISREGVKYGIYFVLTCSGINQVRLNLRQNFRSIYCLQLNNTDDYASVLGKTYGLYPEKHAGRGIFRFDKDSVLEFQVAQIPASGANYESIRACCRELTAKYPGRRAERVPVLPETVTEEYLAPCCGADLSDVPVGVARESLKIVSYNLESSPVTLILSENDEQRPFVAAFAAMLVRQYKLDILMLAPRQKRPHRFDDTSIRFCADPQSCAAAVREIFATVLQRNNRYKEAQEASETPPEFEPRLVIIDSLPMLQNMLDHCNMDDSEKMGSDDSLANRLRLAMEKTSEAYRVIFIVAGSANSMNPLAMESWYKTHISGNRGIWIGNGIGNQYRFTINRRPQGASEDLKEDFGFVITNSTAVLTKFLQ